MLKIGDRVRLFPAPNVYAPGVEPDPEVEWDFKAVRGRIFRIKEIDEVQTENGTLNLYRFHIGHVRPEYSNRQADMVWIYLDDTEIKPLKSKPPEHKDIVGLGVNPISMEFVVFRASRRRSLLSW